MRSVAHILAPALCALVLLAACSSSGPEPAAEPEAASPTEPPPPPTPGEPSEPPVSSGPAPLVVPTRGGDLRGTSTDGVRSFLGIPYAAPPVGERRWRPPAESEPWSGVRDADVAGPPCPQTIPFVNAPTGAEDCLYLNVVTPDPLPPGPAPVMVWIHGGAFTSGDGRQYTGSSDGRVIAARTGSVVVTLNYRLGPLGFLAHHALTHEDPSHPSSGNYGLQDQIAALEWVERNIAAFGGDPENVTLFGESAGGWSVCALLTSPLTGGLFHRAIVQSGPCTTPLASRADAERQGERFAERLGCGDSLDVLGCLREAPTESVLEALPPDPNFFFTEGEWGSWFPIVDGAVLTEDMETSLATGSFHRVPLLIGTTADEGTLFVAASHDQVGRPLQAAQYRERLETLLGGDTEAVEAVLARYPLDAFPSPFRALSEVVGDALLACPTIDTARLVAPYVATFLYRFDYAGADFPLPLEPGVDLGAFHSADVQFVFGVPAGEAFDAPEEKLSDAMIDLWARFAANGDPGGDDAPAWPALNDDEAFLALGTELHAAAGARSEACAFWRDLGAPRAPLVPMD